MLLVNGRTTHVTKLTAAPRVIVRGSHLRISASPRVKSFSTGKLPHFTSSPLISIITYHCPWKQTRSLKGGEVSVQFRGVRTLSSKSSTMAAGKIDGNAIAKAIRERIRADIKKTQETNPRYKPSLTIVQVGDRSDSSTYVRMKLKAAEEADIICTLTQFPESITEPELLQQITRLNNDPSIHGIIVQLPVPKHISEHTITSAVAEEKDIDGFGAGNIGELAKRGGKPLFTPCTPKGVMVLLKESGVEIKGKHAVVLGRSDIVGSPVGFLLRNADATVTTCHSRTQNLQDQVKRADILVAAIGQPNFVKGDWLKPGVVVIDVGTNHVADESRKTGQRLVGDVDYESAAEVASMITPVPGGVGPMTVAMLLQTNKRRDISSLYRSRFNVLCHPTSQSRELSIPSP